MGARQQSRDRSVPAVLAAATALLTLAPSARAQSAPQPVVADRTAVRFVTPETGGNARPRFLTEREIGFFARLEAAMEGVPLEPGEYPDRYVRLATDRLVARAMLASLMVQSGSELPDLPKLATEARANLADRVGGAAALEALMKREGIEDAELATFLRDEVRATYYIDKGVLPILSVTEDALRETYRTALHPYKGMKFEDTRGRLLRWVVSERERGAELEFLQGARARVKVMVIP